MLAINCVIITIVINIGASETGCPVPLCVCKAKTTARCMNHEKDLDYIPQLPSSVKILDFVNNYLPHINRQTFVNLSSNDINRLNLTQNRIQTIANDSFVDFKSFYVLDLSSNIDIHLDTLQACFASIHFGPESSLHLRNVSRGGIIPQNIFQHLAGNNLMQIDLKRNNLIEIDGKLFQNLHYLNILDVSENSISILNYDGLNRLSYLNIDHNNLRKIPNFCSANGSSLAHHLSTLHITNNRVQFLKTNDFQCAVRIEYLHISKNPLSEIQNNVFAPLKRLGSLTIHPSRHTLKHIHSYAFNASSFQSINLAEAYFKFKQQTFDPDNIFNFCPSLYELVLSYNSVPSDSKTTIRMFGTLRRLKKLVLLSVGWHSLPGDLFHRLVSLKSLELGNNKLVSVSLNNPFRYVKGLDFLGLRANKLNTFHKNSFPDNIVHGLKTINLGSNPYICNCNLIWFITWLNNTNIVIKGYPENYYCVMPESWKGKLLNTFSEVCTEHQKLAVTIIVAISCSILVVMVITTITVYKMRWHIRYWIYLIRAKHGTYTRLSNTDYVYDGFVVYCDEDRKWVHEKLVPVLEEEYGHKLCIHYRDFQVGKLIVDNIVENMKESRKVILVMSNAFARSEWCQFEVSLAQDRFLKNGSDTLVTVLLEDVSSRHFTNALKIILTSTTYAIWSENEEGQRLFWIQLLSTFTLDQPPDYDRINV